MPQHYLYLFEGLSQKRFGWVTLYGALFAAMSSTSTNFGYRYHLITGLSLAYSILLCVTIAGNLRQDRYSREKAQFIGVPVGAVVGLIITDIIKGRNLLNFFNTDTLGTFIAASIFGCIFTAILIVQELRTKANMESLKAESLRLQLEKQELAGRLQVMQAQIEPHFLFNTLANVQHLVESDAKAAVKMLDSLIRYLRMALPTMRGANSTVSREMDLATAYLEIFKVRMGERLSYSVQLPSALRACAFPPMMLITLVENAIKHGIDPSPTPGSVILSAAQHEGKLFISVTDTGAGLSLTGKPGMGLANIRERLSTLYGNAAQLRLEENTPRGVIATIELPLLSADTHGQKNEAHT